MKKIIFPLVLVAMAGSISFLVYTKPVAAIPSENKRIALHTVSPEAENTRQPFIEQHAPVNVSEQDKQHFTLQAKTAQTIVGKSGTLLLIPAHAFVDKNGHPAKGKVQLELVEALSKNDIVKMNLGTMSDRGILQSGGMLFVDAKDENGEALSLAEHQQLGVEIPVAHAKAGMQLWEGNAQPDGSVSWSHPSPLNERLREVPLASLDTSRMPGETKPPMAETTVSAATWGNTWQGGTKTAEWKLVDNIIVGWRINDDGDTVHDFPGSWVNPLVWQFSRDGRVAADTNNVVAVTRDGGAEIVRLTDEKFLHTNIATAEFRSRLPLIRQACDAHVMNCYTDFPKRELWKSDSAAAALLDKNGCDLAAVFHELAKLKQSKVDPKDPATAAALDQAREKAIANYSKRVHEQWVAPQSYSFGMKQLGWANVDRLCSAANTKSMFFNAHVGNAPAGDALVASLMVPALNIFIPGYQRPNGDYSFTHGEFEQQALYPQGEEAYLLFRSGSGDHLRYALKKILLGNNTIENVTLTDGTEADLAKALGNTPEEKKEAGDQLVDDSFTKAIRSGGGCLCGNEGGWGVQRK